MPKRTSENPYNHPSEEVLEDLRIAQDLCEKVNRATFLREEKKTTGINSKRKKEIQQEIATVEKYIFKKIARFIPSFAAYAQRKVYVSHHTIRNTSEENEEQQPETFENTHDLVQDFIKNRLLKSPTFCNYEGRNNARLLTFLYSTLEFEILTFNEKIEKKRAKEVPIDGIDQTGQGDENGNRGMGTGSIIEQIPEAHQHSEVKSLIKEAIGKLETILSNRDKIIFFKRLSGIDHKTITRQFLDVDNWSTTNSNKIKKEEDKVRQSYSRTTVKLNILITRILVERGLQIESSENGFSISDNELSGISTQENLMTEILNSALLKMSDKYPEEAFSARNELRKLNFSQKLLLFGKINDIVFTLGKKGPFKILQRYVDEVLQQKNMEMTIERCLPVIKSKKPVTLQKDVRQ